MKRAVFVIGFMYALIFVSCNEKVFTADVNCDECSPDKPAKADVEVEVTLDNLFSAVPITIYDGDIENNKIVLTDTAYSPSYYASLKVNQRYTVQADYRYNGKTFHAVNSVKPKVLTVNDACDGTCYIISNNSIDVRIKKEFLNY